MTVNKAILVGRLGADPELRNTNGGMTIAKLRVATTERKKDQDGNWGEHTEWHTVTAFGNTAEAAGRFLSKGRQVYVEGRIRTRKWQDKEGQDRWSTEIVCDTLQFLGSKGEGGGEAREPQGRQGGRDNGNRGQQRSQGGSSQRGGGGGYGGGGGWDDGGDIPF